MTRISWPLRLKIGARTKKGKCLTQTGPGKTERRGGRESNKKVS